MKGSRSFIGLCMIALVFHACGGANRDGDLMTLEGKAQGTTFTIKYIDPQHRDLSGQVDSLFKAVDASLSLWDANSTVSQFNAAEEFTCTDPMFLEVLHLALQAYGQTQGAFDPSILPVLRAYGLGPKGESEAEPDSVVPRTDRVELTRIYSDPPLRTSTLDRPTRLTKGFRGMEFDPNGIAQGYTVDLLCTMLDRQRILNYMVEVGGEVRTRGKDPGGEGWSIGIDEPEEGSTHQLHTAVPLEGGSLATSGNYRHFLEMDGQRVGHVIDPWTGKPVEHGLLSVSVMHARCAFADAYATGLLVMGPRKAMEWALRHPETEVYLIMDDGKGMNTTWATSNWPGDAQLKGVLPEEPTPPVRSVVEPIPYTPSQVPNAPIVGTAAGDQKSQKKAKGERQLSPEEQEKYRNWEEQQRIIKEKEERGRREGKTP